MLVASLTTTTLPHAQITKETWLSFSFDYDHDHDHGIYNAFLFVNSWREFMHFECKMCQCKQNDKYQVNTSGKSIAGMVEVFCGEVFCWPVANGEEVLQRLV